MCDESMFILPGLDRLGSNRFKSESPSLGAIDSFDVEMSLFDDDPICRLFCLSSDNDNTSGQYAKDAIAQVARKMRESCSCGQFQCLMSTASYC